MAYDIFLIRRGILWLQDSTSIPVTDCKEARGKKSFNSRWHTVSKKCVEKTLS